MAKMHELDRCLPADCEHHVIAGGNHAQFGSYGKQNGDGNASVSAEDQQRQTAELVTEGNYSSFDSFAREKRDLQDGA